MYIIIVSWIAASASERPRPRQGRGHRAALHGRGPELAEARPTELAAQHGQSPYCTKVLDFGEFDSSRILIVRGGVLMSMGDSPESLSQKS